MQTSPSISYIPDFSLIVKVQLSHCDIKQQRFETYSTGVKQKTKTSGIFF